MKKSVICLLITFLLSALFVLNVSAETQIKNVIYMIVDGGGYGSYDFAEMVKKAGGFESSYGPNKTPVTAGPMTLSDYLVGSITTYQYGGGVTDSAAAGTALSTGHKTNSGRIGVDPNGKPVANILEAAQSRGKSTGLIATYEWMHATPASFSAHAMDRNDYKNLYQQIENQGIEVVLGTGYGAVSSYATIQNAVDRGYTVINNKSMLANVKPGDKLWGNMANNSFSYDVQLTSSQATLAEMTQAAITALSGDEDGFFLMVEGSKVDTGGHANNAVFTTSEFLAFDAAFKTALDFAKTRTDTVIICVPDHDTGGLKIKSDMTNEVKSVRSGTNPSAITWESTNHTGANGGIWMYLPTGVSVIDGLNSTLGDNPTTRTDYVIDNTKIAPYIAELFGVDLTELTNELFADVTDIGNYYNGTFTFYNGDKYVNANESVYYKNGEKISMDGEVAVYVNGKFYVPAKIIDDADWDGKPDTSGIFDGIAGTGTKDDPYIIADANDFIEFTHNILGGEQYSGKYIKQTADLNLADNPLYKGMNENGTFAGTYDGKGHTIKIAISTSSNECVFPYVTGTIMNLGTTGTLYNGGSYAAGIVRSLRSSGKIVNCYSTVSLTGKSAGLVWSNYGQIINSYFGGKISGGTIYPIAYTQGGGTYTCCYYRSDCGVSQGESGVSSLTSSAAAETLNSGLNNAASVSGIEYKDLLHWKQEDGGSLMLYEAVPTVTAVTVTPSLATVKKGSSVVLKASVKGENEPSQEVLWSLEPSSELDGTYITEDGKLFIDANETLTSFTVMAKSKQNGSISGLCAVTVTDTLPIDELYVGDINLDGMVTAIDAVIQARAIAGWNGYEGYIIPISEIIK